MCKLYEEGYTRMDNNNTPHEPIDNRLEPGGQQPPSPDFYVQGSYSQPQQNPYDGQYRQTNTVDPQVPPYQAPYNTQQQYSPYGYNAHGQPYQPPAPPPYQPPNQPYQPPYAPQQNFQPPFTPVVIPARGFATASLVLGIIGLCFCMCSPIISIACSLVAIILGGLARSKGNVSGSSTAGLVCGIVSIVIGVLFFILYYPTDPLFDDMLSGINALITIW